MACNDIATGDAYKISARIVMLNEHLDIAYKERLSILQSPEQYSLDTGNTRQFVIKQRLNQVTQLIAELKRDIAENEAQLEAISGGGGVTVLQPSF
jgi:hypothetical protein